MDIPTTTTATTTTTTTTTTAIPSILPIPGVTAAPDSSQYFAATLDQPTNYIVSEAYLPTSTPHLIPPSSIPHPVPPTPTLYPIPPTPTLYPIPSTPNYQPSTPNYQPIPNQPPPGFQPNPAFPSYPNLGTTIRLLHQDPSVKRFTGNDPTYSALSFLEACEDCMVSSNICSDADKISFVRSQLVPNSRASELMHASCFNSILLGHNYAKFRENFLRTFGSRQVDDVFSFVYRFADSISSSPSGHDYLLSQSRAGLFANEAFASLQPSKWFHGNFVSAENFRLLLEFFSYVLFLSPHERRVASSLPFNPSDSLLDFVSRLSKKLNQSPKVPSAPINVSPDPVPVAAVSSVPATAATKPASQQKARNTSGSAGRHCTFCKKSGHTYQFCFQRNKSSSQQANQQAQPPQQSTPPSSRRNRSSRSSQPNSTPPTPSQQPVPLMTSTKFCHLHGDSGHSTSDCRVIQGLRRTHTSNSSPQSSKPAQ